MRTGVVSRFSMRLDDDEDNDGDEEIAGSDDGQKCRHGVIVWRGRRKNDGAAGSINKPTGSMSGTATVDDDCGKERRWRRRDDGGRPRRWHAWVHDTDSRGRLHDAQECSRTRTKH